MAVGLPRGSSRALCVSAGLCVKVFAFFALPDSFGTRYLLKREGTVLGRILRGCASVRLFLEKLGDCFARIASDNQPLLCRTRFTLLPLPLEFLCHVRLISQIFLAGEKLVPRPGVGPGWSYPRECKSRLSTSSSTGARIVALNVGAVDPFKDSPAPTFSGPFSAAPLPSSWCVLLPASTRLYRRAQQADHSFQNLAVCFGKVRWVLDKTVRHPRKRQTLKSARDWNFVRNVAKVFFVSRLVDFCFCRAILFACCIWRTGLAGGHVWGEYNSGFAHSLSEKANGLRKHLAHCYAVILESLFQFSGCSMLEVQVADNWRISLHENFMEAFLEFCRVFPKTYQFPVLGRGFTLFIYQVKKLQARDQRTVLRNSFILFTIQKLRVASSNGKRGSSPPDRYPYPIAVPGT